MCFCVSSFSSDGEALAFTGSQECLTDKVLSPQSYEQDCVGVRLWGLKHGTRKAGNEV